MKDIESRIAVRAVRHYQPTSNMLQRTVTWVLLDDNSMWKREAGLMSNRRLVDSGWVRRGMLRHERWQWINFWMESGFRVTQGPAYNKKDSQSDEQGKIA